MLLQIADATFEPLGLPPGSQRLLIILLIFGFPVVCVLAWIYDITPHGIETTVADSPAVAPDASVAILPFADMSQSRDQNYFCDGLAEEIINALCAVHGLRVASRTSSFQFRDGSVDTREIARRLNVASILEGSVRKVGDRVRVTAQLVGAVDGYHLWSESFDRRLEDIFAIQEEIAHSIVGAFRLTLTAPEVRNLQRTRPRSMEAYEFYLRGRQLVAQTTSVSWAHAPQMFRRAIELDPEYAAAYAGLADILAELIFWGYEKTQAMREEALTIGRRALELGPELAEAHAAFAHTQSLMGDDASAEAGFRKAIELNPGLYEAHYYFGRHCYAHGLPERAVEYFEEAHRARPDEFQALTLAANAAEVTGNRAHARAIAGRALQSALHQCALDPESPRALYMAGMLHQYLGDTASGQPFIEDALRQHPHDYGTLYNAGCFFAKAGDTERALELLDRAVHTDGGYREWIEHDPDWANVREDPRFNAILAYLK